MEIRLLRANSFQISNVYRYKSWCRPTTVHLVPYILSSLRKKTNRDNRLPQQSCQSSNHYCSMPAIYENKGITISDDIVTSVGQVLTLNVQATKIEIGCLLFLWTENFNSIVYEEFLLDYESPLAFGSPWFTTVAFAPDGMTGYIAILGNDGETWRCGNDSRQKFCPC